LNLISEDCYWSLCAPELVRNEISLTGFGAARVKSLGYVLTNIVIDDECFENITFHVVPKDVMPFAIILGHDFLCNVTLVMDGSRVLLLKPDKSWFRYFMCGMGVSSAVVGFIEDPVLRKEVERLVDTYQPEKTREAPIQLRIIVKDDVPVAQRPRRLAIAEQKEVERQTKQWLEDGIIRVSFSEYASPIVLVKKKDGSTRICIDYRRLSEKIMKDEFPLPIIEDHIDKLVNAKVFSTLDLKNGYFHLGVHEDSIKYTSFVTHHGQFEFLKAPFGISICPKVFTRFITVIFRDLIEQRHILVFIDDIIIISDSEAQAVERLKGVLVRASQYGLEINWKKTRLIQRSVEYLGHVIENGTVKPSPDKTNAVIGFPQPTTLKQLHSFIGLTSYFRKFIQNYASIARPLTELLKENVPFVFDDSHKKAFEELKLMLTSKPVLNIFNPELETELHTDASLHAYAAVLMQRNLEDGQLHPVHYMSKKTTDPEKNIQAMSLRRWL
jgi:hypothetical protein